MSDLLQIGASGIRSYQTALTAIGENVSNASTAGFTRRTVTIEQVAGTAGGAIYYNNNTGFGGSRVTAIGRDYDQYLSASQRTATTDAANASTRQTWLTNTETALGDDATGVGQSATALFNAGTAMSSDPGNTANRQTFLAALNDTVTAFNDTASRLSSISDGIAQTAQTTVQTINASLDSLQKVNDALRSAQDGTSGQANLLDQRDKILNDLSGNLAIDVSFSPDGSASVKMSPAGVTLVSGAGTGNVSTRLALQTNDSGRVSIVTNFGSGQQQITDVGGTLGGLIQSAGATADRRDQLNQMAADFATALNGWQAGGQTTTGATGTAGVPLVSGTSASTLALTAAASDTTAIAAASSTSANGNLLNLSSLRTSTGVEARWNSMVTDQGQITASATSESTAAAARADAATTANSSATGVDLDTEAANLLRYQQAYNAAAKVISTARETLQSLMDIM